MVLQSCIKLPFMCIVVVCLPNRSVYTLFRIPSVSLFCAWDGFTYRCSDRTAVLWVGMPVRLLTGFIVPYTDQENHSSPLGGDYKIPCTDPYRIPHPVFPRRGNDVLFLQILSGLGTAGHDTEPDIERFSSDSHRICGETGSAGCCNLRSDYKQPCLL